MVKRIDDKIFKISSVSGCWYEMEMYSFDGSLSEIAEAFDGVPGVYVITHRLNSGADEAAINHKLIYAGACENLGLHMSNHPMAAKVEAEQPNCFCLYPEPSETIRYDAEADIIGNNEFVCSVYNIE